MKTCSPRQLLSMLLVFSFAYTILGADSASPPKAVLHASGKVQVNGSDSRKITTLFPGDSIQTDGDSVANIIAGGSSVLIMPNASVKFLGNAVEVDQGGVAIATSVGMAAKADELTMAPVAGVQKQSRFEVTENEDSVVVAAQQGNVAVSDGQQTSTTQEGQETTHKKKKRGGGAAPAAGGTEIDVKTVALASAAVGGMAAGLLIAESNNDKKKCVSPSGNKKCKCKKDKHGKEECFID
jgi:hypothetical protein